MLRPLLLAALLGIATPALHAAQDAAQPRGQLLDRVVAIVNDGIVTESELDEQVEEITERLREQATPLPPQDVLRQQILERLIIQEIQLQRADRLGLAVSDEQLNEALVDIAQRNQIALADLPQALAAQGVNYASYRDSLRKEIILSGLRQRDVLSRINVTPRELEQFLERLKKLPSETTEYNLSHILVAIPQDATQAQVDEAARKAQEVHDRAIGGEDFGRLAVAFSNSQTALEGGSLGWRKGPELPTFLTDVIASLKEGDVSEPIRTPSGFHLVRLNAMRDVTGSAIQDQVHARHILMRTNELQDDATVRQRLEDIRSRILAGEAFEAFASSLSEDPGSAVAGGDLGWTGPGTYVPEFEQALQRLQVDEISEPFQTPFGWHIVQLLGRRQFDTTEDNLRQQALAQIRESRADEETELWLRQLREEAYVDTNI